MGAESGSQRILDAMDKGNSPANRRGHAFIEKVDQAFILHSVWLPDRNKRGYSKTISMINELLPFEIGISVSYPLPGTVFFEKVKMNW
jgi:hypothetical protein